MKLMNNSENTLIHGMPNEKNFYKLEVGKILNVPDEVAELWLKYKGVIKYAEPKDVEKVSEEKAELEAKVKELEKKLADKKPAAKKPAVKKNAKKK